MSPRGFICDGVRTADTISGVWGHREAQEALDMPYAPSSRLRRVYPSTADGSYPSTSRLRGTRTKSALLGHFAAHRIRILFSNATPALGRGGRAPH